MAWIVQFDAAADRDLKKIDQQQKRRILKYLKKKIATKKDPRRFGDKIKKNCQAYGSTGLVRTE